jgi:hypothetical protein
MRSLCIALALGLAVPPLLAREKEEKALELIQKLGGEVSRDENTPGMPVVGVHLTFAPIKDQDLADLAALKRLQALDLVGTVVTGEGLRDLCTLRELKRLYLGSSGVRDAGLKGVSTLVRLEELSLFQTKVTDEGLRELTSLKELRKLDLGKTKVTEKGVSELQKALPNCKINR